MVNDILALCKEVEEAHKALQEKAVAIVDAYWDELQGILTKNCRDEYQQLTLAYEAAFRDMDECMRTEAEMASFKD